MSVQLELVITCVRRGESKHGFLNYYNDVLTLVIQWEYPQIVAAKIILTALPSRLRSASLRNPSIPRSDNGNKVPVSKYLCGTNLCEIWASSGQCLHHRFVLCTSFQLAWPSQAIPFFYSQTLLLPIADHQVEQLVVIPSIGKFHDNRN